MSDSSDSDTEDDSEQLKMLMQAADTTLLANVMFQMSPEVSLNERPEITAKAKTVDPQMNQKSDRYLPDEDCNNSADVIASTAVQKHVFKKLSDLIEQKICFYNDHSSVQSDKITMKSRVKLLRGADCPVNSYEEFEFLSKGPCTKPIIKRRIVDVDEMGEDQRLRAATVEPDYILSGVEVKYWARKPERKNRLFHYRASINNQLHAKEMRNEFTAIRQKNKWNESKIRRLK